MVYVWTLQIVLRCNPRGSRRVYSKRILVEEKIKCISNGKFKGWVAWERMFLCRYFLKVWWNSKSFKDYKTPICFGWKFREHISWTFKDYGKTSFTLKKAEILYVFKITLNKTHYLCRWGTNIQTVSGISIFTSLKEKKNWAWKIETPVKDHQKHRSDPFIISEFYDLLEK